MNLLLSQIVVSIYFITLVYGEIQKSSDANHGVLEKPKGRMLAKDLRSCPAVNPEYPLLLPHPTDCTKFFICDRGSPHLKDCQSGLHFNPEINACDYPQNVDCDVGAVEKPKGKIIDDDDSDICPEKNPDYPVLLPHPTDCKKFYICNNGSPHLKECQTGLHFNPKIKSCDYPENAKCDMENLEKPKSKVTDDDLDLCPAKNSMFPVYLPHPTDCNKFYICNSGTPHLKKCQTGLHFSRKIKACDYPENAGCDTEHLEKPKGRVTDDDLDLCPAKNSKFPAYLPHPTDCSKFYICDSGIPHLKKCQPGLHFSPKIKTCDYPENAGCDTEHLEKPKGKVTDAGLDLCPAKNAMFPVYLAHPTDCSKFYICDSGIPHLKSCQPGLHFSPKIKACDYPENVGCDAGMMKAMAGVPSPFCPSTNGKIPIFFRHPTNCSVFYMCGNGLAYEFVCPARLHFNVRKRVCDYESSSNCVNS